MLFTEMIDMYYFKKHSKHVNTMRGQNAQLVVEQVVNIVTTATLLLGL
jgi:hypothetical protein